MGDNDESTQMKKEYGHYTFRKVVFISVSIILVFILLWVSLCVGTRSLSIDQVYSLFWDHVNGIVYPTNSQEWFDDRIVWEYRVPRALFAIIAGVSLAVAGSVMQSVMKNPLADPYTTGVSSGALFGVAVAIVLGLAVGSGGIEGIGVVINAMIFAMVPVVVIVLMAPFFKKSPASLILAGVAVSYLFNSLTSLLLITTDAATLHMVYIWQIGSLADLTWDAIPLTFLITLAGLLIVLPLANKLNLMSLDDKTAKSMGLDVENLRILCLCILSLMATVVISYVGVIGFVGLVVPHIVRLILGSDNKYTLPATAAFGALFLLGCDIISRAIDVSAAIPVGVVTSFVGAPIFLYLIIRQKRTMW